MSDENQSHPDPVPPADPNQYPQEPVPPGTEPVPPAQQPVPPAYGANPVPPAENPVPPAQQQPYPGVDPTTQQPYPAVDPATQQPYPQQGHPIPPDPYSETNPYAQVDPPPVQQQPVVPPINQPAMPAAGAAPAPTPARSGSGGRRKRPSKKSSRKRGASRGTSPNRPGSHRRNPKPVEPGFSMMSVLMVLVGLGLAVVAVRALMPVPLTHLEGYPADTLSNKEPRNLLAEAHKLIEQGQGNVTFTEQEVNDYFNYRLQGTQEGLFGSMMKVTGVYIDFKPNEAEIFLERSFPLFGRNTMSTTVKSVFNRQQQRQFWSTSGGSIGKINLKSKNIQPVVGMFVRMSKVAAEELSVMSYMADIDIDEGKITLKSSL